MKLEAESCVPASARILTIRYGHMVSLSNETLSAISPKLVFLKLANVTYQSISPDFLSQSSIRLLYLNNINLKAAPIFWKGLASLVVLDLNDTEITEIPTLSGSKNLRRLSMNRNKIFEILPDVLANAGERLTSLLLRNNYIRKLHPRCFFGLSNLEELDLSNNFLNNLPPNRFQDLHSLRVLFVFRNNIHTISTLVGVKPALIIWIDRNRNCSSFDLGSNITCRPVQARNAYAKIFILEDRFDDCSSSTCFNATCLDLTGSFTCKHPATEFTKRIICRE